ncbi:MAG: FAD:protein FMN transferase [Gemmatimonadota bacterium]
MKARWLLGAAGLALLLYLLPSPPAATPAQRHHLAMGTVVSLSLYVAPDRADSCMDLATREIDRVDSLMSDYSAASEVARINRTAASGPVACGPELLEVVRRSLEWSRRTDGAVDVSLGALTRLWGFPDATAPPAPAAVDSARARCGYEQVALEGDSLRFRRAGLKLDLGADAKGYAVDRAVAVLMAAGVEAGVVEAGGDLRFWGAKPDGRPWRFGVQHPRLHEHLVEVEDVGLPALATSGDYEQYYELGGRRYHHLLDRSTGYPADRAVSATAWAGTAMDADALATAFFVMGPEAAVDLAEATPGVEALVYYERDGRLQQVATSGLRGRLHMPPE